MSRLVRLTVLIGILILASGAPAYARGGGGGGGGHFGGGAAVGGGHTVGGGHAFGGPHWGFGGQHGFAGHHFIGVGPYWDWDPYFAYWPYGAYAYAPSAPAVQAPPAYIEKPQAGYCPSGRVNYDGVQSCGQPWLHVTPHAG